MIVMIDGIRYMPELDIPVLDCSFSNLIKLYRENLGYTLDEAARYIGCSKSYLWSLENGRGDPSLKIAFKIRKAYSLNLESMARAQRR